MRTLSAIASAFLLAGCVDGRDYSSYADVHRPMVSRISSLDARLRGLLGDPRPDTGRVRRILDTLVADFPAGPRVPDPATMASISRTLTKIGINPVLHPSDSDLVPSLAWERRRAGCVPLVLFWTAMARHGGIAATPVLLPGHCAMTAFDGLLFETLRGGVVRDRSFYDSAFRLDKRPYYAQFRPDSGAILASMLIQAGLLEWKAGRRDRAISAFDAAVAICPGLPEAEGNLGLVLEESGRETEAIGHLESAVRGDRLAVAALARLDRMRKDRQIR